MTQQTVTVLGAGIVGICCALSLAERGEQVRVIDKDAPGRGASYGNAGVISPWSFIPQSLPGLWRQIPGLLLGRDKTLRVHATHWPQMVGWGVRFLRQGTESRVRRSADAMERLCGPSVDLYRRHLAGTGHEDLVQDSCYIHAVRSVKNANLSAIDYVIRREKGAQMALVTGPELAALEPALSDRFKAAIVIGGQARATAPGKICDVLAEKARQMGVSFERDTIQGITPTGDGWRVSCADKAYDSDKIVLAMGIWSAEMMRSLGIHVPLQAERGYHTEFRNPGVDLKNSVLDVERKVVLSSMDGAIRLAGQAEFAAIDAPPDPSREAIQTRQAADALRGLNTDDTKLWMGHRPSFPDSLPALGEVPGHPGLIACFGHSHYGLMMGPKSGELVADIVTNRAHNADLLAYNPLRFS